MHRTFSPWPSTFVCFWISDSKWVLGALYQIDMRDRFSSMREVLTELQFYCLALLFLHTSFHTGSFILHGLYTFVQLMQGFCMLLDKTRGMTTICWWTWKPADHTGQRSSEILLYTCEENKKRQASWNGTWKQSQRRLTLERNHSSDWLRIFMKQRGFVACLVRATFGVFSSRPPVSERRVNSGLIRGEISSDSPFSTHQGRRV